MSHPVKKVKVLIYLTHFYPHLGGVERYIEELFSRIVDKQNFEVHIIALDNSSVREETYRGMHVHRVRSIFSVGNVFLLPNPRDLKRCVNGLLKQHSFKYVVTVTRFFYTSYLGMGLARRIKASHIHIEHGGGFVQHPSLLIRLGSAW